MQLKYSLRMSRWLDIITDQVNQDLIEKKDDRFYFFIILQSAYVKDSSRCIVNKHEKRVDSWKAYRELCDRRDGPDTVKLSAKVLMHSLTYLKLIAKKTSYDFINWFIEIKDQIDDMGEGETKYAHVKHFLVNSSGPDYVEDSRALECTSADWNAYVNKIKYNDCLTVMDVDLSQCTDEIGIIRMPTEEWKNIGSRSRNNVIIKTVK